jgi:hypothetical protein
MNNVAGLLVFALGVVLLIFGFNESRAFQNELARILSSQPGGGPAWLVVSGAALVVSGMVLAIRSVRR